jgi:hypothetical protein
MIKPERLNYGLSVRHERAAGSPTSPPQLFPILYDSAQLTVFLGMLNY